MNTVAKKTVATGPLTLIRAGDWVVHRDDPDTRWFIKGRAKMWTHLMIERDDLSLVAVIPEVSFTDGTWRVIEPNPDINATILGAYNAPGGEK